MIEDQSVENARLDAATEKVLAEVRFHDRLVAVCLLVAGALLEVFLVTFLVLCVQHGASDTTVGVLAAAVVAWALVGVMIWYMFVRS